MFTASSFLTSADGAKSGIPSQVQAPSAESRLSDEARRLAEAPIPEQDFHGQEVWDRSVTEGPDLPRLPDGLAGSISSRDRTRSQ